MLAQLRVAGRFEAEASAAGRKRRDSHRATAPSLRDPTIPTMLRWVTMEPERRLIVALDVPTLDEARDMVCQLANVYFFKVGWQLVLTVGVYPVLESLRNVRGKEGAVFIDLKMAGDIGNTMANMVRPMAERGVRLVTLQEAAEPAVTDHALGSCRAARTGPYPEILMVPLLSSLAGPILGNTPTDQYIVDKGKNLLDRGCDGLVVSGTSIRACREALGQEVTLVSPGIRPEWAEVKGDDQVRTTTPREAIQYGADYLVVGRPIIEHHKPREAAQRVIDEIAP